MGPDNGWEVVKHKEPRTWSKTHMDSICLCEVIGVIVGLDWCGTHMWCHVQVWWWCDDVMWWVSLMVQHDVMRRVRCNMQMWWYRCDTVVQHNKVDATRRTQHATMGRVMCNEWQMQIGATRQCGDAMVQCTTWHNQSVHTLYNRWNSKWAQSRNFGNWNLNDPLFIGSLNKQHAWSQSEALLSKVRWLFAQATCLCLDVGQGEMLGHFFLYQNSHFWPCGVISTCDVSILVIPTTSSFIPPSSPLINFSFPPSRHPHSLSHVSH